MIRSRASARAWARRLVLRFVPLTLALGGVLLAGACEDGPVDTEAIEKFLQMHAGPASMNLMVGESSNIVVTLVNETGANVDPAAAGAAITFTSANMNVATVDNTGRVVAVAPGVTLITGKYQELQAQISVQVNARPTSLALSATSFRGAAGGTVPGGVGVTLLDRDNQPVSGLAVRFTVLTGGGTVNPAQATSGADGRASTAWTLGSTVGRQSLQLDVLRGGTTASTSPSGPSTAPAAVGEPGEVLATTTVFADADPSPASNILITPASATLRAGESRVFQATIVDQFGNASANQAMTFASSNPNVMTVSGSTATAVRPGTASFIATSTANPAVTGSATVTVTSGAATTLVVVSGGGQTGVTGAALGAALVVEARDLNGNAVSGVPLTWTTTGGTLSATSSTTDANGRGQAALTLGAAPGTYTVTAASTGLTSAVFTETAVAPPVITTASLANAPQGGAYAQLLAATGGTGTYVWSVTTGTLPAGLTLNASTGVISGVPTTAGTSSFTVQATSAGASATKALSITVTAVGLTISTTSLPNATQGVAYSTSVSASGGSGAYSWSLASGSSLPAGLALNGSTGAIAGTPTTIGIFSFTVQVSSDGQTATKGLGMQVLSPVVTITTSTLPNPLVGVAYNQSLTASGGNGSYVWAITAGSLPAGLSLNPSTGAITGTATATGTSNFTVSATSGALSDSKALSLTVTYPPVSVTTATLPAGTVGVAYSQTLAATGGTGTFTWSVTVGSLPAGLTLNPSTGAITGTPSGAGTSNFTVQASSGGQTGTAALSITTYSAVTVTTASLPTGATGIAYSQTLAAAGGGGTYTWSITAGTLPTGLSLNASTGAITGTPSGSGTSNFTVQASSVGLTGTQALSITVYAPVSVTTASLPGGTRATAYSQTLAATGGSGTYTWSVTVGALPAGLTLNPSTGAITGTPTLAAVGTTNFTVQASSAALTGTKALSITVVNPPVDVTTTSLAAASLGVAYSQTLAATGGDGTNYAWAVTVGSLPAGLSLNPSTGAITGAATGPTGTVNFTVQATSAGLTDTQALSIVVFGTFPPPDITTTTLPNGAIGVTYNQTVAVTGGDGNYAWSVSVGSLPAGLTLNPSTGAITGTPTGPTGTVNFTLQASSAAQSDTQALSITIYDPVDITTTSLPDGTVGVAYSQTLAATGGTGTYAWSVTVGTLPAGLTLNPSTGAITGTPTNTTGAGFTVQASSGGLTDAQALSITRYNPVDVTTTTLPNAAVGVAYNQTVAATGGSGSYTFSITAGALPAGLTLNPSTGAITGTPTGTGAASFTVQALSVGLTDSQAFSFTVYDPVDITTTSLPNGTVGVAYSQTLTATGGDGTYAWAVTVGTLPAGLTLNPSTGAITGTPTNTTGAGFTVQATSAGLTDTQVLTITRYNPVVISTSSLPNGTRATAYNQTLAATGGSGTYAWSITSGTLPTGLSLNPSTGAITGTPSAAGGPTSVTFQASSVSLTDSKSLNITVVNPPVTITTGAALPAATRNVAYSTTLAATGGDGATYAWSVTVGTLPTGLTLDTNSGVISGTPTVSGTSNFTIQAQSGGNSITKAMSLGVSGPPDMSVDFSTYANTAALMADKGPSATFSNEDALASQIVLDTGVGYGSSTKSMRYDYPNLSSDPSRCGGYTVGRNLNFLNGTTPVTQTEVWAEIYIKFSPTWQIYPNFMTSDCGASYNPDFKLLFGRMTIDSRFEVLWGNSINGNVVAGYPGNEPAFQNVTQIAPYLDNNWHQVRVHWKYATSGGIVQLWIDGTRYVNQTAISMPSGKGLIYGMALGRNRDPGTGQAQSMWWGSIKVWYAGNDPGW